MLRHLFLALFVLCPVIAAAEVLSNTLAKVAAGVESAQGNTWLTASFGTGSSYYYTLESVTLLLANTAAGQATLYLYSDGGVQPGSLLGALTSPGSYSSTSAETVFSSSGITLSPNTTYWLVLKVTSGKFDWAWTSDNTGDGAGFQHIWGATDDAGSNWYTFTAYSTQFRVSATTGANCSYTVDSSTAVFPAAGGAGSATVTAPGGCSWTAVPNGSWLSLTSTASGSGNGTVFLAASANTADQPRTGSVRIAGNLAPILQSGTAAAPPYDDVPNAHPYADYIRLMKSRAITSGCSATQYCPDAPVSRGQMAVFIIRALLNGDTFSYPDTPYFSDVSQSHPYFKFIQKMRELNITTGCTVTAYCPDDPVTRGQMAVFLVRGLTGDSFSVSSATPYFTDAPPAHPFFQYIQKLRDLGITSGCSAAQYCPDASNTRGQMAVFLVRALLTPQ